VRSIGLGEPITGTAGRRLSAATGCSVDRDRPARGTSPGRSRRSSWDHAPAPLPHGAGNTSPRRGP